MLTIQIHFCNLNVLNILYVCKYILLLCENTMAKWRKRVKGEKRRGKKPLVIPWISLSKLQLQRIVDLIMSISISDMQNILT